MTKSSVSRALSLVIASFINITIGLYNINRMNFAMSSLDFAKFIVNTSINGSIVDYIIET